MDSEKTEQYLRDLNEIKYKEIDGMKFHQETPNEVCKVILDVMAGSRRVILHYGDTANGKDWMDKTDCIGFVNKNTRLGIPMLCEKKKSSGFPVLDHKIVRITDINGKKIYRHQLYHE